MKRVLKGLFVSEHACAGSVCSSESRNARTRLQSAVTDVVRTALRTIDLRQHSGSHPRLGVVDHICTHPLGTATMTDTTAIAEGIASEIGQELKGLVILHFAPFTKCGIRLLFQDCGRL